MKVEKEMTDTIFLKPKLYCFIKEENQCKGGILSQNKKNLTFEKYKEALLNEKNITLKSNI